MSDNTVSVWLLQKPAAFLGFKKRYNFPLFVIFAGAIFGFSLARLEYLSPSIYSKGASPGEWYWQRTGHYRVGLYLHLGCILPAGLLMVWQFVPAIRQRFILFHRINGYTVILLVLGGNAGALMMGRRAFGGDISIQAGFGLLVIISTASTAMAVWNIKKLQIEQHRAWMLRAMFYICTIVTLRIIMILGAVVVSAIGSYYTTMTCGEVAFINRDDSSGFQMTYPECIGADDSKHIVVHANLGGPSGENAGASLRVNFGMAIWMALFLHAVGVEIYLRLTPREAERLRQVSATRQMEAGFKHPGSAGLVVERFGDADGWKPYALRDVQDSMTDDAARKGGEGEGE